MTLSLTIILVIITVLVSIGAFRNEKMMNDLVFYPPAVSRGQWYRFFSHGFIHADVAHLAFNMIALWSFGEGLERVFSFDCIFGGMGRWLFLLLYFSAFFVASFPDYLKYKDSYHFRSLGASGAVSAIIFSMILFFPQTPIGIIILPGIQIPGWIFGLLYLGISVYLDKRGGSTINHSAHFWGAAYGIGLTIALCVAFAEGFDVFENFITQLKSSSDELVLRCK